MIIVYKKMNLLRNIRQIHVNKIPQKTNLLKNFTTKSKQTSDKQLNDFLPDHIKYNVPKYKKNPIDLNFPLLINGAPKLDVKVSQIN